MKSPRPRFDGNLQLLASQFSSKCASVAINFSKGLRSLALKKSWAKAFAEPHGQPRPDREELGVSLGFQFLTVHMARDHRQRLYYLLVFDPSTNS
jgi:hypothetical protein